MTHAERRPSRYDLGGTEILESRKLNRLNDIQIHVIPQTDSTMTYVDDLAKLWVLKHSNTLPPIIAVVADHQTAGVGRGFEGEEKKWHDLPEHSVLVSMFVPKHKIREEHLPELMDLSALKTCIALRNTGGNFLIKAPNDIVDGETGKKVSGLLTRPIYDDSGDFLGANIGIGINVHYSDEELANYPTDPDYGATSVDSVTGKHNNRLDILIDVLFGISVVIPEAGVINKGDLLSQSTARAVQNAFWRMHSYLLGKNVSITEGDTVPTRGKVIDAEIGDGITVVDKDGNTHTLANFGPETKVRIVS